MFDRELRVVVQLKFSCGGRVLVDGVFPLPIVLVDSAIGTMNDRLAAEDYDLQGIATANQAALCAHEGSTSDCQFANLTYEA